MVVSGGSWALRCHCRQLPHPPRARVRASAFTSSRAPSACGVRLPWQHPRMLPRWLPATTASPGRAPPWPWLSFSHCSLKHGEPALQGGPRRRAPHPAGSPGARAPLLQRRPRASERVTRHRCGPLLSANIHAARLFSVADPAHLCAFLLKGLSGRPLLCLFSLYPSPPPRPPEKWLQ